MTSDPILVVDGVTRGFGGVRAVDVDHLEIPRGAITALIGPNGAGKTTLFNVLTGFDRAERGRWSFDGVDLSGMASHRVARHGMVRTFQLTRVLGRLTVLENMLVGSRRQPGEKLRRALFPILWKDSRKSDVDRARALLARFTLGAKADDYAASLSGGQRKLLEMARALMNEPTLVLLDEPMAGVNPALAQSLLEHILELKAEGRTVLFIEHDLHLVKSVSDWVVAMAQGRVVAEGTPESVLRDPAVVDAYLGAHHDTDLRDIIARELVAEEGGMS
jgi:neutral amino acid transport system ATP-binding protein